MVKENKMNFKDKLNSGKFIVTSEIGPPKGIDLGQIIKDAQLIMGRVDGINVTDLQNSVMRLGSLAACRILKENGFETILQITCRDRNRLALQSDLLSAAALGINNILILTGDYTTAGDHPEAKPVFDLDSVQLLQVAKKLTMGLDMKDNKLTGIPPEFCLGAVVNPGADPIEPEIFKMEKKIAAGAEFFQTQAVYDIEVFESFVKRTSHLKTKILAGIVLLKSSTMAKYMNDNVAGVFVPERLIKEIDEAEDKQACSVNIASRLIKELKPLSQGVHIMPIGWNKLVPKVLDASNL